ncbi:chemotaxis protein CheW [Phenylobacterium sp. LjRoot164]|uniref:chemotaxis protein CheA n=1 Tax=unclassified Phenylobacterium TaxID=2640670 RepID=UPI003ED04369
MDELLEQFLIEGPDQVAEAVEALLALERTPNDAGALDRAFRAVHTLKGSTGLFDLPAMAATLHAAEDVLADLRSGRRTSERPLIDALMGALNRCESWMSELAAGATAASLEDAQDVLAALTARAPVKVRVEAAPTQAAPDWARAFAARAAPGARQVTVLSYRPDAQAFYRGEDPLALAAATPGLTLIEFEPGAAAPDIAYDPYSCRLEFRLASSADIATVREVFQPAVGQFELFEVKAPERQSTRTAARFQRIDQSRIDTLLGASQDLTACSAELGTLSRRLEDVGAAEAGEIAAQSAALTRAVGRLQDEIMSLRMAPIGPLLRRYRRLARELAAELGKPVEVELEDGGLEADRDIIDGLAEPLTHVVRNAMSHGIERTRDRVASGKSATARLTLTARRVGARLVLRVIDDGGGLDLGAIRRKAAERNLASASALAEMSDDEAADLVFLPGFSTAEGVSALSGRGVGMDAVRSALIAMGGEAHLQNRPGLGVEVVMSVPFRMAMSSIVVVRAGSERFGVLLDQIQETILLAPGDVHPIRAGYAIDWRGQTTPLLSLAELVQDPSPPDLGQARRALVLPTPDGAAALAVQQVLERRDVILRPLSGLLAHTTGVAGSTTLEDGRLLLVLDLEALVR